jgi:hypothetical protein
MEDIRTMKHYIALGVCAAVVAFAGHAISADALKSGPQVGESIPGPFNVLNACNAENPKANGNKTCLV